MKFNYSNLNDLEFEELCKDIMQRILGVELRTYASGKDNGIDLKDNEFGNNIVIQVKHYIKSRYSDLKRTLEKELPKVDKLSPNKYFICCSQELSPQNIKEIYKIFENYMESTKNIITIKEIDDFLQDEKNNDIVRKNFKLWLSGSNILSEVYNQDVFIDCEVLLSDIAEEYKYYVETDAYYKCLEIIEKKREIIIIGSPGTGKTVTSKMLALYYVNQGYRLRYTTNGDISNLKKSISLNKDKKEIILLDDCLGQCYFKMKENQENEIISLIKYVKMNKNKILILNSRVTIINEAKRRYEEFDKYILKNDSLIYTINIDNMNIYEKAKILYNHIYFQSMPIEYYEQIILDKRYLNLVKHKNYTPRIIEYLCDECNYRNINLEDYYSKFILKNLNNPEKIWKNEYDINLELIDRVLINILYSLTEDSIEIKILEECFNNRVKAINGIDGTVNNFENSISRLNKSMIKIIDINGEKKVSVLNPSVNDFLKNIFFKNSELEEIKKSIVYHEQISRCYNLKDEFESIIKRKINDNTFLNLKTHTKEKYNIETLLLYFIVKFKIYSEYYIDNIKNYILKIDGIAEINKFIISCFLSEPFYSYYNISRCMKDISFLDKLLDKININDAYIIYNKLLDKSEKDILNDIEDIIIYDFQNKIDCYLESLEDTNLEDFFQYINYDECNCSYDDIMEYIEYNLEQEIEKISNHFIREELYSYFNDIDFESYNYIQILDDFIVEANENYDDYTTHEEDNALYRNTLYRDSLEEEIDNLFLNTSMYE